MEKCYWDMIFNEFRDCVENTISRLESEETYRPFHAALLSDEALFWSRFERSFSTSLGQRTIEEVSKIVALAGGASDASRQKEITVRIDTAINSAIDSHMADLRSGLARRAGWGDTVTAISRKPPSGIYSEHRIISDLWWQKNGINHYMSIKTVKPNIDQTAVAKGDLLRLTFDDDSCKVFFGLYYNPYGEEKSTYAHNPPMSIFDFHNDEVVLIGQEYWDTLGNLGCYETILEIANTVGAQTKVLVEQLRTKK